MIQIFFSIIPDFKKESLFKQLVKLLPKDLADRGKKFYHIHDKISYVSGKLLLMNCLNSLGFNSDLVNNITYSPNGKPFLKDLPEVSFSISHSGIYVICAISKNSRIGVDVEKITDIELGDFSHVFSPKLWSLITSSHNPVHSFFSYWTKLESVVKADGRGFSFPLDKIVLNHDCAYSVTNKWYLKEINLHPQYCVALAYDNTINNVDIKPVNLESLICLPKHPIISQS